jgi:hypothetical protein
MAQVLEKLPSKQVQAPVLQNKQTTKNPTKSATQ